MSGGTLRFWNVTAGGQLIGKVTPGPLTRYYYLKDHLGSIRSTINTSNAIVGRDDYDPWGMILEGRSYVSSADARFGYISKERDAETGNYWLDVRPYVPNIGRLLTPDPLMDKAPLSSWSPYHYSYDNPVLFKDPSGKNPEAIRQAAGALFWTTFVATVATTHAIKYATDPSYRRWIHQTGQSVSTVVSGATKELNQAVGDLISNIFHSEQAQKQTESQNKEAEQASGVKSLEEYTKHQENLHAAKEQVKELEKQLSQARGPKKREPIEEMVERLNKQIKGHEKEIRQKWPDGPPSR